MKTFTCRQQVRFGDVDPAGIVYFPRIFDYLHRAFEELWETHVEARYYYLLLERRMGFPLVHSEVAFKHPLRFGDRPLVRISCFKLGETSIGLHYVYTVDDVECVDARMTTVCVHTKTMKTQPLPPEFRERFEELLELEP